MSDHIDQIALAARNNADWCSIVSETHGVVGTIDADAWACATRTPEYYPDAVTLRRGVDVERLLARVDASSGCSVKDSFADLDLAAAGFDVLFEASWIRRAAGGSSPGASSAARDRWRVVRDPAALQDWEGAWLAGEPGPRLFRPALLDLANVAILAIPDADASIATAVLNATDGVVGLSNVVTGIADPVETFIVATDAASTLFPGLDIVGYERGELLDVALDAGFEAVGPLRVWMRD